MKELQEKLKLAFEQVSSVSLKRLNPGRQRDKFEEECRQNVAQLVSENSGFWRIDYSIVIEKLIAAYNKRYGTRIYSLNSCSRKFLDFLNETMAECYLAQIRFEDKSQTKLYCDDRSFVTDVGE